MNLPRTYGGHLMAILTCIIWGTTFVSTKVLINNSLTPVEILIYRFAMAYLCIWLISPRKLWADNLKDESLFVLSGLTGGSLYFLAENTALELTLASNVGLIISATPIITAFVQFLIDKREKPRKSFIIGSLIALLGVAFVIFNGSFMLKLSPLGDLLTLTAAFMWAFYCIIFRKLSNRYPTAFITRKVFFYGVATILPMLLVRTAPFDLAVFVRPVVLMNLLFLGLIASMLCYMMWNLAVKRIGTMRASNYLYLTPLITLFTSALVIDEPITWIAIIGCILILSGVYMAERN
ncbi:MAG: DMT family transporter [Massilibacteroides sp.]|nr:DMT family transporter [Massilibacteroides sp.]MDD3062025.1 DMT family transporter [Massilibacteroides sp.]MDD4114838.1 DMT family transporter [Massilibacteroides sp.]MDD4659258.1 DMT family transporter [Massilibacteroides sp.]